MPEISIIVPIYNVEKYLNRCVQSILSQTFTDFELLLIDDGSPDNCPQMCDNWEKIDNRITVIHKENGGLSDARNVGLEYSCGEWITFVDSDDWIHPEFLNLLHDACICTGTKVSVCGYIRTDNEKLIMNVNNQPIVVYGVEDFWCKTEINHAIATWGKLFNKDLCKEIKFPVGKLHEDVFTTHEIIFRTDRIASIPSLLYFYYINYQSITGKGWYPKRMDAVDGFRCQIEYFRLNGYKQAEMVSAKKYCEIAVGHYEKIKSEKKYKKIRRKLKHEIRSVLITYKDVLSEYGDGYYYFQFFPFEMKTKNYWNAIRRKLKLSK